MLFLTNINLNGNELQNVTIQNLAVEPSNPKAGQIIYNSTTNKIKYYNGTEWIDIGDLKLPIASTNTLGGVKIDGDSISIDESGTISTTLNPDNVYTKTEIDEKIGNNEPYIDTENNALVLPSSSKYTIEDTALVINL